MKRAEKLLKSARKKRLKIVTAESCTGGMVAAVLTDIAGSSDVFERGFITYSNQSKTEILGVSPELIKKHGAVSQQVACAMALGALKVSSAQLAIAITGVAGPGGGTKKKPVGVVHIAVVLKGGEVFHKRNQFIGKRADIRKSSVKQALTMALELLVTD